jgi:hypothetical protein
MTVYLGISVPTIPYIHRGERLTPQMGVFFECYQSMRAIVCYSQTWLKMVAHATTAAGQLSFIEANVGPYA